jgi:hypothetical protein
LILLFDESWTGCAGLPLDRCPWGFLHPLEPDDLEYPVSKEYASVEIPLLALHIISLGMV